MMLQGFSSCNKSQRQRTFKHSLLERNSIGRFSTRSLLWNYACFFQLVVLFNVSCYFIDDCHAFPLNSRYKSHLKNHDGSFRSFISLNVVNGLGEDDKVKTSSPSYPPQLVSFREPKSNTNVILIGTMHYNPTSIRMVQDTIRNLHQQNALGSVVVESCDIRWNTTMELLNTPRGKFLEPVLTSEMKAASDLAMEYGRPCILGDQRINATGTSLGQTFRQTFVELLSPFDGGWKRLFAEFKESAAVAVPTVNSNDKDYYLDLWSILDPRLLIAAPVSFTKYPLSFLARNPISTLMVFSILGGLSYLDYYSSAESIAFADATLKEQIWSIVVTLMVVGLEFVFFGRILVQVMLAERNEIIAKNIIDQCKMYSTLSSGSGNKVGNDSGGFSVFSRLFPFLLGNLPSVGEDGGKVISSETMYVPGSINMQDKGIFKNDGTEKTVVAVLGMAHCNGIVKLLKEGMVA